MIPAVKRTPFKVMSNTVHALLMRELKTRFGNSRLGYFWALAEPIAQVAVLAAIFTFIRSSPINNVPIALFLFTGLLPFKLFQKLLPQLASGVSANKALFGYRQVSPIDPILTRLLIEVATFALVYLIIMLSLAWFGFAIAPDKLLPLITVTALLILMSFGLGLALACAVEFWQDTPKLLAMLLTPMFYLSGIFYTSTMVPPKYWPLLTWNPVFHIVELSRDAYFESYVTPVGDWGYVAVASLLSLVLGLGLYRINRVRLIR